MQTFLIHTRHPVRLFREIGAIGVAGFLMTSLGAVLAAMLHPVYLATALVLFLDPERIFRADSPILAGVLFLNVFNFVSAYLMFALLARSTYRYRKAKRPAGALPFLPAYWLLLAIASARAFGQLVAAPHRWVKTPHVGRRARKAAAPALRATAAEPVTERR